MSELRYLPFYRVLYRPNLMLGGNRDLVAMTLLCCAAVALTAMNIVAFVGCFFLWLLAIELLRRMAKSDPVIHLIYFRQVHYQKYYPARSTPFCEK